MTLLDAINVLDPTTTVWVDTDGIHAAGGTATPTSDAQIIDGLDGRVLRLLDADVTVTGAPDFSPNRAFTLMAWVRCEPRAAGRRIIGRQNGATLLSLDLNRGGNPAATVSSTAGSWSVTMTGNLRVDDGRWHLLTLRGTPQLVVGVDVGGIELSLDVDGVSVRTGYIRPGLFGRRPVFSMTTPIILGRSNAGSSPLHGDLGPSAVWSRRLTDSEIRTVWSVRPEESTGFTGWGIRMG